MTGSLRLLCAVLLACGACAAAGATEAMSPEKGRLGINLAGPAG